MPESPARQQILYDRQRIGKFKAAVANFSERRIFAAKQALQTIRDTF